MEKKECGSYIFIERTVQGIALKLNLIVSFEIH